MNVKELREKAGITQEELAFKTGIPRDRIAKWEQGRGNPKTEDFKKLQDFFQEKIPHRNDSKPQISTESDLKDKHIQLLERENSRLQKDLDVSLNELNQNITAISGMQAAIIDLLLVVASKEKTVYNKSVEVLKRYNLEGSFL